MHTSLLAGHISGWALPHCRRSLRHRCAEGGVRTTGFISLPDKEAPFAVAWDPSQSFITGVQSGRQSSVLRLAVHVSELMVTVSPLASHLRELEPVKAVLPYQFGLTRETKLNLAHGLALVDWAEVTRPQVSQAMLDCDISCEQFESQSEQGKQLASDMTAYLELQGVPLLSRKTTNGDVFPYMEVTKRERNEDGEEAMGTKAHS